MTDREKEIAEAAENYASESLDYEPDAERAFKSGAQWADAHPKSPGEGERARTEAFSAAADAVEKKLSTIMAGNYSVLVSSYKSQLRRAIEEAALATAPTTKGE